MSWLLPERLKPPFVSIIQIFRERKDYLERYELNGGIVRYDEKSEELCICMDTYSDDINSDSWKLLSEVID